MANYVTSQKPESNFASVRPTTLKVIGFNCWGMAVRGAGESKMCVVGVGVLAPIGLNFTKKMDIEEVGSQALK